MLTAADQSLVEMDGTFSSHQMYKKLDWIRFWVGSRSGFWLNALDDGSGSEPVLDECSRSMFYIVLNEGYRLMLWFQVLDQPSGLRF